MKHRAIQVAGWGLRVSAWAVLGTLLFCLTTNYQGVAVRCQVARTDYPPEKDRAAMWLLQRGGASLHGYTSACADPHREYYVTLISTLIPKPVAVELEPQPCDPAQQCTLALAFGAHGAPLGAPVNIVTPALPIRGLRDYHAAHILTSADTTFVVDYHSSFSPRRLTDVIYRVYRPDFPESPLVLVLNFKTSLPTRFTTLAPASGGSSGLEFQLWTEGKPIPPDADRIVRFKWDAANARFILPPPDTEDRWRAAADVSVLED
ncbi:MAG TPA: hypothetical protein P5572_18865 [Phycisphaerae bacterium]|nr:hypothetical protein [Phycisphaerae bacterium]